MGVTKKQITAQDKKHAMQIALKMKGKVRGLNFVGRKFGMSNYEVFIER